MLEQEYTEPWFLCIQVQGEVYEVCVKEKILPEGMRDGNITPLRKEIRRWGTNFNSVTNRVKVKYTGLGK